MKTIILLSITLFIISYILPNHYLAWISAYHDFAAFAAGLLLIGALLCKRSTIKINHIFLFIFVLIFIPLLQYVTSIIYLGGDALISCLYLLGFFAMLATGYNLANTDTLRPALINWLAGTLIIAATISVGLALYQWTLQPSSFWIADLPPNARPFANLSQPNQLATLLSMGLAAVLFFTKNSYFIVFPAACSHCCCYLSSPSPNHARHG